MSLSTHIPDIGSTSQGLIHFRFTKPSELCCPPDEALATHAVYIKNLGLQPPQPHVARGWLPDGADRELYEHCRVYRAALPQGRGLTYGPD